MAFKDKNNIRYAESAKDYDVGYRDGIEEHRDSKSMAAYYAGVGYGKHKAGERHLGFTSEKERYSFDNGVRSKDKHFRAHSYKKPGFFEWLFSSERKAEKRKKAIRARIENRIAERLMRENKSGSRRVKRTKNKKFARSFKRKK